VPFTLSHAAAALPLRRAHLVVSALVAGTFAPDLEYFIRLVPGGGWGHTLPGLVGMSLPLGLAALWIFHRFVKVPLACLLPTSVRARLTSQLLPFRFGPLRRFLHIVISILIGMATHILWDAFTHPQYGLVVHLRFLWIPVHLPVLGWEPWYDVLQLISSVMGLVIVAAWCVLWYRCTKLDTEIAANPFTPIQKLVIVCLGIVAAILGAILCAFIRVGVPKNIDEAYDFVDRTIVAFGALIWWQLAVWGLLGPFRSLHRTAQGADIYTPARESVEQESSIPID
jgi:hypothetical protein